MGQSARRNRERIERHTGRAFDIHVHADRTSRQINDRPRIGIAADRDEVGWRRPLDDEHGVGSRREVEVRLARTHAVDGVRRHGHNLPENRSSQSDVIRRSPAHRREDVGEIGGDTARHDLRTRHARQRHAQHAREPGVGTELRSKWQRRLRARSRSSVDVVQTRRAWQRHR